MAVFKKDKSAQARVPVLLVTPTTLSWDDRYREEPAPTEPSRLLVDFARHLPREGRALDLACGGGRNSVFLAEHGLRAVGIDRSRAALEQGRELARRAEVSVAWIQADLESFALSPAAFDVVLCCWYRAPNLYSAIRETLRPSGLLIYETFTREQLRFEAGPKNPKYLLDPGELLRAFGDWELIFYRETWIEWGTAALVAQKPKSPGNARI